MKETISLICAVLVLASAGCAGARPQGRPSQEVTQDPTAGQTEEQAPAEDRAAEEISASLVEIRGRTFRSPKEAGAGRLTVGGGWLRWNNDRRAKRDFSIQARIVREASLVCATRAGSNVCLELELRTVTGERYRFRDVGWSAGHNEEIRRVYDFLQATHPRIVFQEKSVDRVR